MALTTKTELQRLSRTWGMYGAWRADGELDWSDGTIFSADAFPTYDTRDALTLLSATHQ